MTDYDILCEQAKSLIEGVPYLTADLANLSALIYGSLENVNWAGFYLLSNDKLILGPFQGKPACIEIPVGRGVCGTAVLSDKTIRVENVDDFAGHIACDSESRSEIVVPLHKKGRPFAVLDIDSKLTARFTKDDQTGLEKLCKLIESLLYDLF